MRSETSGSATGGSGGCVRPGDDDADQNGRARLRVEGRLAQLTAAGGPLRRTLAAIRARLLDTQAIERRCYARLRDSARKRAGARYGAEPGEDMRQLWRRIVSAALISTTDDHLRNHGFLYAGPGACASHLPMTSIRAPSISSRVC